MKKLVALILTLMLVLSFATVSFAASTKGTAVAGTSKSKTATALNPSTWTSDITLSLPSAEEKLETDVVFGSMSPIEELKTVGIDMSTPAPIEAALDVFASLLADFQG